MPVETFAAFVTEQALEIAVGVIVVVAAPKLVRATHNVQRFYAQVAAEPASKVTYAAIPVTATGQTVYDQVIGGFRWYGEQWQDLIAEAKELQASRIAGSEFDPSNLPVIMAEAPAISDLPGRLRLDLKQIRRHQQLADECITILKTLPGIDRVQFNSASWRVLLFYDPDRYPTTKSLRQAIADVLRDERISRNG